MGLTLSLHYFSMSDSCLVLISNYYKWVSHCSCLYFIDYEIRRLPRWLSGKESACQCRRCKRYRFNPCVGKIPWRRKWQSAPMFLPGKLQGQRSLVGYSPWGCTRVWHDLATIQGQWNKSPHARDPLVYPSQPEHSGCCTTETTWLCLRTCISKKTRNWILISPFPLLMSFCIPPLTWVCFLLIPKSDVRP